MKTCVYGSEPGRQAKTGTCVYDSESGRQVLSERRRGQAWTGGLSSEELSVTPQDEVEADHLIRCVLAQTVTRHRARQAVLNEAPRQEPSEGLRQLVAVAQKEDPFCRRVDKDLSEGDSIRSYDGRISDGMLYKGRMVVPN